MAVYKVPQDVEADDKLIGPFSFRQFIYLIVVAISGAGAWGLSTIFIPLAIIPIPFIIFFAALALPLRKDQPMETYLSAVISFYFLKSRRRFWQPDGIESFVTIIPSKEEGIRRVKDLNEDEATRRLDYLANLVDTHGWSVRGAGVPAPDTSINQDLYYESQATADMMDTDNAQSQRFTNTLQQNRQATRQSAIATMQQNTPPEPAQQPDAAATIATLGTTPMPLGDTSAQNPQPAQPTSDASLPATDQYDPATPFNPVKKTPEPKMNQLTQSYYNQAPLDAITYAAMLAEEAEEQRRGGQPNTPQPSQPVTPPNTSAIPTPDATMEREKERVAELAHRDDISVQTIAEEANRMKKKEQLANGDEVTISLR